LNSAPPLRFGIAALLLGNLFLSFGPWFVRMADTGPVASAFWRVLLAAPALLAIAWWAGKGQARKGAMPWGLFALSGLLFAADLASWHNGILQTKLANSNLLGNSTSLFLPLWAFIAARSLPTRMQGFALGLALVGAARSNCRPRIWLATCFAPSQDFSTQPIWC
jgi:drug/metabolite transporter (DMT)-like permease